MRAALWWIDRWRKSTAFTDMTLEEQGAYRNLCDEIYLRPDGVIPDGSLARASGDAAAWPKVKKTVLKWMKRVPGGWTNETALELKQSLDNYSQKQRDRANSRWERERAAASATAGPVVMPAVSVTETENEQRTTYSVASAPATPSWSSEACDDWKQRFNGTAPGGQIGKALKPLVTSHGWPAVRQAWVFYLSQTEAQYASPTRFATTFGQWSGTARDLAPLSKQRQQEERTKANLQAWAAGKKAQGHS